MKSTIHFVALSGSLRRGSYNTLLLRNMQEWLPEGITMQTLSYADLPFYNADLDTPQAKQRPASVDRFREGLAAGDALVIVSPEYNYSIPGPLKNAIDWASRGEDSPLLRKPVAVMGATPGMWGTVRMQLAFQSVFLFLDMKPVLKPEVLIAQCASKYDEHGHFLDEMGKKIVVQKLEALKALAQQVSGE